MIEATVAMAAMAGLFVAFGLLRVADREGARGCGHEGRCGGCSNGCEHECGLHDTGVSS